VEPDPIGYDAGMNMYGYAAGDPVNVIDPSGMKPGDRFSTPSAAALDATSIFHSSRGPEWIGGIYMFRDRNGKIGFTYDPKMGSQTTATYNIPPGRIASCGGMRCVLVAVWHTHPNGTFFSETDQRSAQRLRVMAYVSDKKGRVYLYIPPSRTDGRHGNVHVFNAEARWQNPFAYADHLLASARQRFGPLSTAKVVGYDNQCVFGDVDVCEGLGSLFPMPAPPELSTE
jgi:hypothetical protein